MNSENKEHELKHKETHKENKIQVYAVPILAVFTTIGVIGGLWYWKEEQKYVYTDKATVSAPLIQLAPHTTGTLKSVMIHEGDMVKAHQPVAQVGNEKIMTENAGLALVVKDDVGSIYAPGKPVVTMIDPKEVNIVAQVDEDKGLRDIRVGQKVRFTVDAFGSEDFYGYVDSVKQINRQGDVVFSISDKREKMKFEVKIKYDSEKYKDFRNGMSAKVWIDKGL